MEISVKIIVDELVRLSLSSDEKKIYATIDPYHGNTPMIFSMENIWDAILNVDSFKNHTFIPELIQTYYGVRRTADSLSEVIQQISHYAQYVSSTRLQEMKMYSVGNKTKSAAGR